jgi:hypothetical protein
MRGKFPAILRPRWWCFELGLLILRLVHKSLSTFVPYSPPRAEFPAEQFMPFVTAEVRESTIPGAGQGLFAVDSVEPGIVIGEYLGDPVDSFFKALRMPNFTYLAMWEKLDGAIDAIHHPGMAMRYVNHHPDPESSNILFFAEGRRVFLRTTRKVDAGAEFFANYAEVYWRLLKIRPSAPRSMSPLPSDPA